MTTYAVAIRGEEDATRTTSDVDEALDWYTNACTEVIDPEGDLTYASLSVDGIVWASAQEGGIQPDGGEVINLKAVA